LAAIIIIGWLMEEELQEQLKEESGKSKSRKLKTAT
jgi:hypothetical protein